MAGYIKSLHTHLRTLLSDTQDGSGSTKRLKQHMKYLQFFQTGRAGSVKDVDIDNLMYNAGPDAIFDLPEDEPQEESMLAYESVSSNNMDTDEDDEDDEES